MVTRTGHNCACYCISADETPEELFRGKKISLICNYPTFVAPFRSYCVIIILIIIQIADQANQCNSFQVTLQLVKIFV